MRASGCDRDRQIVGLLAHARAGSTFKLRDIRDIKLPSTVMNAIAVDPDTPKLLVDNSRDRSPS
ncbi:MAG: hypothetical protein SVX43_18490, partial [Cyanobacteriota bacterium]|nr:hypothetical protein [Cyanobacteriota bacterium]